MQVIEGTMRKLKELNKPFKYVGMRHGHDHACKSCVARQFHDAYRCLDAVTAVIMQKNGAGLHTATSCFWDQSCDGSATLRWENKSMYCLVTVFGLSI